MTSMLGTAAVDGIQFFGRISASISHELKNSLSIMNESAGLLEDLSLLAEKGRPLDLERVKKLSGMIKRQIQRTDQIIRNMNRFSHSVDDPFKQVDLFEFLTLVIAVSRRLTEVRGVTVNLSLCPETVSVISRPFYLHHLIWRIIDFGMDVVGASKTIEIEIHRIAKGVEMIFSGLDRLLAGTPVRVFPDAQDETLLAILGAAFEINDPHNQFVLVIPERLDI